MNVIPDTADTAHSLSRYSLYVKPDIKHNTLIFEEDRTEVREIQANCVSESGLSFKVSPER